MLGVTGSIAAYKAAEIASRLAREGACVTVVMTESAQRLVGHATFESLSRRPVVTDLWERAQIVQPGHIGLAEQAEALLVAPATANFMAKLAHGLADDALSCVALAAECPLVIAPAMNDRMYAHPATQANVATLRERGAFIVEPAEGRLASGKIGGKGRLADIPEIIDALRAALAER